METELLWEQQEVEDLLKAFLALEGKDEAKAFLRDLLTEKELRELSLRWKTARMLHQGIPYSQIEKETGLSSTTVARISKWLSDGEGGYEAMLKKFAG